MFKIRGIESGESKLGTTWSSASYDSLPIVPSKLESKKQSKKSTKEMKKITIKILLLGDSYVGKTSYFKRYIYIHTYIYIYILFRLGVGTFDPAVISTIGVDFLYRNIVVNEEETMKIKLFDTAGQEKFRSISSNYVKGSDGIFLMFDLTSRKSFENIEGWTRNIEQFAGTDITKILIGTKYDLVESRVIDKEELEEYAIEKDIKYFETSAKENINVEESVEYIIDEIYKRKTSLKLNDSMQLTKKNKKKGFWKKCCRII